MTQSVFVYVLSLVLLMLLASVAVYLWGADILNRVTRKFSTDGSGEPSRPEHQEPRFTAPAPSIVCVAGEFSGSRLPIVLGGLIIGRSAEKSNVVLSSVEVSAAHAKVWSDVEGRVWVEDMSSTNGTYYCRPQGDGVPEWIQIKNPVALASGSRFRLGEDAAIFMVS
jgi:hypothetical protein